MEFVSLSGCCWILALAGRTVESRAAALHDPPYRAVAARSRARLALAVIYAETMLEIAERSVRLDMVAQRRAAGIDRFGDDGADGNSEPVAAFWRLFQPPRDRGGDPLWRQSRPPERLAYIDVAEPGDEALVHQCGLQRRPLAAQEIGNQ